MTCPKCGGKVRVIMTNYGDDNEVYRRRACTVCDHIFHTVEYEVEWNDALHEQWLNSERARTNRSRKARGLPEVIPKPKDW